MKACTVAVLVKLQNNVVHGMKDQARCSVGESVQSWVMPWNLPGKWAGVSVNEKTRNQKIAFTWQFLEVVYTGSRTREYSAVFIIFTKNNKVKVRALMKVPIFRHLLTYITCAIQINTLCTLSISLTNISSDFSITITNKNPWSPKI